MSSLEQNDGIELVLFLICLKLQKNLYETEIVLFCYPRPIKGYHMKKLSRVTYLDWLGIAK